MAPLHTFQTPASVVIVEDHPEYRESLRALLATEQGFELLALCNDLPSGLRAIESRCPDLLLVDLGLPTGSGLALIRRARALSEGRCNSAVLTVTGNESFLLPAIAGGARGYLFKTDPPTEWLRTIRCLSQGFSPMHAALAGVLLQVARGEMLPDLPPLTLRLDGPDLQLLRHIAAGYTLAETAARVGTGRDDAGRRLRGIYDRLMTPLPILSPRERQLIEHLNQGLTFRQCAERMGIGEATIKTHAARAYEKLGASNLQSALHAARLAGLLPG
jgi:DNA-binding NarL/FixJ family response regulator